MNAPLAFDEVVEDVSGGNIKVPHGDYLQTGPFPVVDQGQDYFGGFAEDASYLVRGQGPWIVFGDHTRALKYLDVPFCMGADGIKVLKPRNPDHLDTKFLYHFLSSTEVPNAGYSRHFKFLRRLKVPLPPLDEQRRIAAILDKADAPRRKRKRALDLLDSLTQSIFLEMFGDPIVNPKGWPIALLGEVCDVRDGTHASPAYVAVGHPLLTSKNFSEGKLDYSGAKMISDSDFSEINKRSKVDIGDIVMPMIGTIGSPVLIDCMPDFAIKNVALFKSKKGSPLPEYILNVLKGRLLDDEVIKSGRGGTQKFLALGDLRALKIPIPSYELQNHFKTVWRSQTAYAGKFAEAVRVADLLFGSLQSRAFSGQL